MIPSASTVSPENGTAMSFMIEECRSVHYQPLDERCDFVNNNSDCDVESFIEYIKFMYCTFDPSDQWIAILISILWTLILFVSLGVAATDFLCPALFMISKTLRMSQSVAGVTLIAFGNGSPDVFAAIAGMMQGRPELVIGALFGGACFVVMIVLGSIFAVKSFKLLPISFLRDILFYAISASWVFYLFVGPSAITLLDGIGLLLFYGFYVALVVCSRFFESKKKSKQEQGKGDTEETHRIVFRGIRADDDPNAGLVIMKKFILYGDDGDTKIIAIDRETSRRSNNDTSSGKAGQRHHLKTGTLATVSAKIAASKAAAAAAAASSFEAAPNNTSSMRVISKSVPDINITDDAASLIGVDTSVNNTPYSTINFNTLNSITNGSHYYKNVNNATLNANNNELTVTSMKSIKSVSICEDNNSTMYDTVNSYTKDMMPFSKSMASKIRMGKRRNSTTSSVSRWSLSRETRLAVTRASREFLDKIIPIDATGWRHRNWGGRSMEVIKAPIRFFLLLTTPTIDVDPHAPPSDGDEVDQVEWNKPLSALHCITGPLFVVFATGYGSLFLGPVPFAVIVFLVATIVSFALIFTSKFETPPSYYKAYCSFLGFVVGVVWVYFISTEVVSNIRALGVAFNLSEPTIGMTILAVGNCLLDFISNVSIARKGYPRMAISACLGSPLLALLLGVGIPSVIMTGTGEPPVIYLVPTPQLVVIFIVIMSSLAMTSLVAIAFKFIAKRWYGISLIVLYFVVIAIVLMLEFEVIPVHFPILLRNVQ